MAVDVKKTQQALNAAGANLKLDGVWGPKTQAAYDKYKDVAFYSGQTDAGKTYGIVDTGNAVSPWATEAERQKTNADFVSSFGLDPMKSYPAFEGDRGVYGADAMGGVFNPYGYSSNPNYLQGTAGITRDMTKGTILEGLSDLALSTAVKESAPWTLYGYIDPVTGAQSSHQTGNMISMEDVRKAYADLTGQQSTFNGMLAPFAEVPFYSGSINLSGLPSQQQALLSANWTPQAIQAAIDSGKVSNDVPGVEPVAPTKRTDEEYERYLRYLLGLEGW